LRVLGILHTFLVPRITDHFSLYQFYK